MEVQLRERIKKMTDDELKALKVPRHQVTEEPLKGENWKGIPDTYGVYQVSNKGRFRKVWTSKRGISRTDLLSITYASSGLSIISYMTNRGVRIKGNLANMVWELFGKTPVSKIIYKDGDKKNCSFNNLISVDDTQYSSYLQSLPSKRKRNLDDEEKKIIFKLQGFGFSQNKIAKIFGVSQSLISRICQH